MAAEPRTIDAPIRETPPEKILRAGDALELRYSSGGTGDYLRKVTCYEVMRDGRQLVISQPSPSVYSDDIGRQVDVTAICRYRGDHIRIGTRARINAVRQDYELAGNQRVAVVQLTYEPQLRRYNLRSSYRLNPSRMYQVYAALTLPGGTVVPQSETEVMDVSCSGVGLKLSKNSVDPAIVERMSSGTILTVDLKLIDYEHVQGNDNQSTEVTCEGEIVRSHSLQDADIVMIGVEFRNMDRPKDEWPISAFVNAAQRYELREKLVS